MAKKIVIDAGHGGSDPGASGNGIVEKDYTLKISKYLKKRFDDLGIESSLTRTGDETLSGSVRPQRVKSFYGNGNDVIVLSNHLNAGGGDGAEIIYALRNSSGLSQRIANEFQNAGQNVRKYYQRRLPSNPSKDYYYILRDTANTEPVIIEYGFLDSTGDDVAQIKNNYEDLAEAVVKAIAGYIGVPYKAPSGNATNDNIYIVKSGDTLWNIAKKYGITVNDIKLANNLSNNNLSIGQRLIIPEKSNTNNVNSNTYVVKSGDTLYGIANKYNTTVDKLKSINNKTSNLLTIGEVLKLPSNNNEYTVKSGDTLYSIANKYNTTVDKIKSANNLSSNLLSIGQKLIIPN